MTTLKLQSVRSNKRRGINTLAWLQKRTLFSVEFRYYHKNRVLKSPARTNMDHNDLKEFQRQHYAETLAKLPLCNACCRNGNGRLCKRKVSHEGLRCKFHGGKSTGATTQEGRDKISKANTIHGFYSKENDWSIQGFGGFPRLCNWRDML